jgi:hypothetical protein
MIYLFQATISPAGAAVSRVLVSCCFYFQITQQLYHALVLWASSLANQVVKTNSSPSTTTTTSSSSSSCQLVLEVRSTHRHAALVCRGRGGGRNFLNMLYRLEKLLLFLLLLLKITKIHLVMLVLPFLLLYCFSNASRK